MSRLYIYASIRETAMKGSYQIFPGLIVMICAWIVPESPSGAQIVPDSTLPVNSVVTPNGNIWEITGGSVAGSNLFHSFEQFSVPTGETALFNHGLDIQNIFSRVTGATVSEIDGLIRANGTANLFLLNPNGTLFGPNARLDIGGSFFASSASSIQFEDGSFFSATDPETSPVLTINLPIGLQFGTNPGKISNQSRVSNSNEPTVGLQIQPGNTLALVGGNVTLDGGYMTAPGGTIELGSLAEPGTVGLNQDGGLSFPDAVARGDILLTNAAQISVLAGNGGSIAIHAGNFETLQGSTILAGIGSGLGSANSQAGDIEINATGNVTISDFDSFIINAIFEGAIGNGGDIDITAANLSVKDGGFIKASTFGRGNAGNVNINVRDTVSFDGATTLDTRSGVYSRTENSNSEGNGGNIEIAAGSLFVTNGAVVTASTGGQGNAGNLIVNVRDIVYLDGSVVFSPGSDLFGQSSGLFSSVKSTGVGQGGTIQISAKILSITDGAVIITNTFNQGNAGNIQVDAEEVYIAGVGINGQPSGLLTPSEPNATGQGGEIIINADLVRLADGGNISSSTRNSLPGGTVTIDTRIFEAIDGGQALVTTIGSGQAGNINLVADITMISGIDPNFDNRPPPDPTDVIDTISPQSGIFASTGEESTGTGGDLTVQTRQLTLRDGGTVSVTSTGVGGAGSMIIDASSIRLQNGTFTAETSQGDFGNIQIQTDDIQLRENSRITTNAGSADGGNISINTDTLAALENSDISANALEGFGGRVTINARGIFGTEFRLEPSDKSDITATSELGAQFSGTVELNTPDTDPTSGLLKLPDNLGDATNLIDRPCTPGNPQQSEFIIVVRSGKPETPQDAFGSNLGWVDRNFFPVATSDLKPGFSSEILVESQDRPIETRFLMPYSDRIVEAIGWVVNERGQIELVAELDPIPPNSVLPTPHCR